MFKNIYNFFNKNKKQIIRLLLFVISAVIILLLIPHEGKFSFEFQKGKPWMHEDLIAPFDFPIYKTTEELKIEKDSLLKDYKPYFLYQEEVGKEQINNYTVAFDKLWNQFISKTSSVPGETEKDYRLFLSNKKEYNDFGYNLLLHVYLKGIVEISDLDEEDNEEKTIFLIRNKIATEQAYSEIFTQKTAYEYVSQQIKKQFSKESLEMAFFKELKLNNYILPNLIYDKETSNSIKQNMISNMSLTRGMVQSGERIISKGELVSGNRYQILESLKHEYESRMGESSSYILILLGHLILIGFALTIIYLFLKKFRPEVFKNLSQISFILFLIVLSVAIASITLKLKAINFYILPFAIIPIILRTFYDEHLTFFINVIILLFIGFIAPNGFEFILINVIVGTVAIFSLTNLYRRAKLVLTALLIIFTYCLIYFGISILQEGSLAKIEGQNFVWFGINGLLILLSYPLIFVFEKIFGFLSDTTLMELTDINQPLLRKLADAAPGTFQHSLQVANLAEEAIIQIGGNPLLVRAGALYHDIGKIDRPLYFIENQNTMINPHDNLEFEESANIIISHVQHGVEIASKYRLPVAITDFIKTHHGTSTVHYFYRSFIKKYPEKEVERSKFTYPGPKPFSKETAIVMMADSVEAASKSLKIADERNIDELVEEIINRQVKDGQFINTNITFRDITEIKTLFKQKLQNIYHARIAYPK